MLGSRDDNPNVGLLQQMEGADQSVSVQAIIDWARCCCLTRDCRGTRWSFLHPVPEAPLSTMRAFGVDVLVLLAGVLVNFASAQNETCPPAYVPEVGTFSMSQYAKWQLNCTYACNAAGYCCTQGDGGCNNVRQPVQACSFLLSFETTSNPLASQSPHRDVGGNDCDNGAATIAMIAMIATMMVEMIVTMTATIAMMGRRDDGVASFVTIAMIATMMAVTIVMMGRLRLR